MIFTFLLAGLILIAFELLYFRWARRLAIIDKPNERSSHLSPTIRGGGIIFFIAVLIWFVYTNFQSPWWVMGTSLVAFISFMDDLKPRAALLRFLTHTIGVLLMFYQVALFDWQWWLVLMALIVCIGALSAFNFMDGINGITGVYALVSLGTFAWINFYVIPFTAGSLIYVMILAVVIFLFFNFRKKAVCFAGDVGSISMAFVQIFFLLQLIHSTGYFYWVLVFLMFGLDAVITIVYRLKRRENIFKAHRTHLYQYLSNELGFSHLIVALIYGGIQLVINGVLLFDFLSTSHLPVYILIVGVPMIYLLVRVKIVARANQLQCK